MEKQIDSEWLPIDSAPKDGTIVRLRCEDKPHYGEHLMLWDTKRKRWAGVAFGVMGRRTVWWDDLASSPTHFQRLKQ